MKVIQLSLFDEMDAVSVLSSKKNKELQLDKTLKQLKQYIKDGVINPSDTYFNIAYHREPKIKKSNDGVYQLCFAQASDSERLLSAYEANPNIKPMDLLGVGVPQSVIERLHMHIQSNPDDTVEDIFDYFRIWNYPTYNWVHAQSESMDIINSAKDLIVEWAKLKEEIVMDLQDTKFSFMRKNKRKKSEDQTTVIPQCFDGLCLEHNLMKALKDAA